MKKEDPQPQPQATTTPSPGTPVIADVFASPKPGGGVEFDLEWRFEGETGPRKDSIELPPKKCGDPGTMIHFHLRDSTDRKLAFDTADPIWVSRTTCPLQPSTDPEIPTDQINGRPKLLKIFDTNKDECELKYTLLFKDHEGKAEPYDPMIRNGGTH